MSIDLSEYRYVPGVTEVSDIDLDSEVVIVDGHRYTEADAEKDADRIERQPRQYSGLRRGGVSMSSDGAHSPKFTFSLPRPDDDLLRARAAAEGMSVSKWTRRLVQKELANA
jgi:hypothetical protein